MKNLNGLVLNGGRSERMGVDKGLIIYHDKPQREYLFDQLTTICEEVFVSCKKHGDVPASLNPITDHYVIDSPLNGILSAMRNDPSKAWLTVPVDMPNIDLNAIMNLVRSREPDKIATCYIDSDGSAPDPLFCLWEPFVYPLLLDFYHNKQKSPRQFLSQNSVKVIAPAFPGMNLNINTPEQLADFRRSKNQSA